MKSTPEVCDALVIGGGPAGSIASYILASSGAKTILLEKEDQHRDKICGDALIPDSLQLLKELGFLPELEQKGKSIKTACLYSPSGNKVNLDTSFICYPRQELDQYLRDKAEEAGAKVEYNFKAIGYKQDDQSITVQVQSPFKDSINISAKVVILASGASVSTLNSFKLKHSESTEAIAGRAYFEIDPRQGGEALMMIWDKEVLPGYGWAFPIGGNRYNVGVGLLRKSNQNIREIYERFVSKSPLMKKLLKGANCISPFKVAPLRCGLKGCEPSKERILVAGEALGSSYHLSGEGIGKAMETASWRLK